MIIVIKKIQNSKQTPGVFLYKCINVTKLVFNQHQVK